MYDRVLRYATIELGDADAAADLVQGVFVSIWHQHFRGDAPPKETHDALIHRMVTFRISNWKRDRARYHMRLATHLSMWAGRAKRWMSPAAGVEHDELVDVIDGALARMTPRSREVFVMRRESGMSFKEIAELTSVGEETVRSLMHRAQLVLREHVDRAGYGSSARRRLVDRAAKRVTP
jgi:RNA polymerase sigma-70 factor (ECF subfamily)